MPVWESVSQGFSSFNSFCNSSSYRRFSISRLIWLLDAVIGTYKKQLISLQNTCVQCACVVLSARSSGEGIYFVTGFPVCNRFQVLKCL